MSATDAPVDLDRLAELVAARLAGQGANTGCPASAPAAPIDLASRLALRPTEAAAALGLSERKLRGELRRIPHVRLGGAVVIPIDGLRAWLLEQAKAEATIVDEAVDDILGSLGGSAA